MNDYMVVNDFFNMADRFVAAASGGTGGVDDPSSRPPSVVPSGATTAPTGSSSARAPAPAASFNDVSALNQRLSGPNTISQGAPAPRHPGVFTEAPPRETPKLLGIDATPRVGHTLHRSLSHDPPAEYCALGHVSSAEFPLGAGVNRAFTNACSSSVSTLVWQLGSSGYKIRGLVSPAERGSFSGVILVVRFHVRFGWCIVLTQSLEAPPQSTIFGD